MEIQRLLNTRFYRIICFLQGNGEGTRRRTRTHRNSHMHLVVCLLNTKLSLKHRHTQTHQKLPKKPPYIPQVGNHQEDSQTFCCKRQTSICLEYILQNLHTQSMKNILQYSTDYFTLYYIIQATATPCFELSRTDLQIFLVCPYKKQPFEGGWLHEIVSFVSERPLLC